MSCQLDTLCDSRGTMLMRNYLDQMAMGMSVGLYGLLNNIGGTAQLRAVPSPRLGVLNSVREKEAS